ncbi:MAG: formylglycine-generating enzyme family protein [Fibrobacter sp.]|jgi:hypothetical protein|nr:formylglycine-generating enzyme family protein [Fibrobacter sp.]
MRVVLVFLLMSVALSFAGKEDKNFTVPPDQLQDSLSLEVDSRIYLGKEGDKLISAKPHFSLKPGEFYLRHKFGPKKYGWFLGKMDEERFQELYAFDLKANKMSMHEVASLKFYGKRGTKAFQDEANIYVDHDYLYTSRIPVVYFVKNGKWESLEASPVPGKVVFRSLPKGTAVEPFGKPVTENLRSLFPVKPGLFFAVFSAPGFYPVTEAVMVPVGGVTYLKPRLVVVDKTPFDIKMRTTPELVKAAGSLEVVELLYDQFMADLRNAESDPKIKTIPIEDIYPPFADIAGAPKDSVSAAYRETYQRVRKMAEAEWLAEKSKTILLTENLLRMKRDSLEALRIRVALAPVEISFVRDTLVSDTVALDSSKINDTLAVVPPVKQINLRFRSSDLRYQVSWTGVSQEISMDSLAQKTEEPGQVRFDMVLQNKPVWVKENDTLTVRYQYRYSKLLFVTDGETYEGEGVFELPPFIKEQEEVRRWLNGDTIPVSEVPAPDTLKKAATDSSGDSLSILLFRGAVRELDSGSFRYRGKIVSLPPFALHKTEVTQAHYLRIMGIFPREQTFSGEERPVHNITWDEANAFCREIGGTLPSETEWEYAGRAGYNEGSLWLLEENGSPDKFAFYRDNSYALGKKDPGYGPQPAALKEPNDWGIFDMSGNVAEWTRDAAGIWRGHMRVVKGGSWKNSEADIDLTKRETEDTRYWSNQVGFRCAFPSKQKLDPAEIRKNLEHRRKLQEAKPAEKTK